MTCVKKQRDIQITLNWRDINEAIFRYTKHQLQQNSSRLGFKNNVTLECKSAKIQIGFCWRFPFLEVKSILIRVEQLEI